MIRHHPSEELLLAYAGGAADEASSLIVAVHMAYCETCRIRSAQLEAIGGTLLQDLAPAPLASDALERTLSRLDQAAPFERRPRAMARDGTPDVLRPYIGGDLSTVRWRRMGPELAYVPLFRRGPVAARLLRGAPGAQSGPHSHHGLEYTLVLQGGFRDVTGSYGPGDLQVMEGDMHHNPIADPGEDCINLAVTTGRLKFERWAQKIVAPFFGF
ncbi:MAG TPA: ChrR family anti-sigma-E factor [Rhizomicrobium sp.]|nr:ChrR family anti-sigma-E factor [Rhizomicrobium sp.]